MLEHLLRQRKGGMVMLKTAASSGGAPQRGHTPPTRLSKAAAESHKSRPSLFEPLTRLAASQQTVAPRYAPPPPRRPRPSASRPLVAAPLGGTEAEAPIGCGPSGSVCSAATSASSARPRCEGSSLPRRRHPRPSSHCRHEPQGLADPVLAGLGGAARRLPSRAGERAGAECCLALQLK